MTMKNFVKMIAMGELMILMVVGLLNGVDYVSAALINNGPQVVVENETMNASADEVVVEGYTVSMR